MEKLGFPILRENFREDRGDWKLDLRFGDSELELSLRGGYAPPVYHDWCIVSSSFKRPAK